MSRKSFHNFATNANFLARGIQGAFPKLAADSALHNKKKQERIMSSKDNDLG